MMRFAVAPIRHSRSRSSRYIPPSRRRYFASSGLSRRSAEAESPQARAAAARNDAATVGGTLAGSQHVCLRPSIASAGAENAAQSIFSAADRQSASALPRSAAHGSYQRSDQASSPELPRG